MDASHCTTAEPENWAGRTFTVVVTDPEVLDPLRADDD